MDPASIPAIISEKTPESQILFCSELISEEAPLSHLVATAHLQNSFLQYEVVSTNQAPSFGDRPSSGVSVKKPLATGIKNEFRKAKQRLNKFQQFGNLANKDNAQHQPRREKIHP